ncbi:hypothetical protein M422DRAFT_208328 [Sphaerobolus stellatus SS14]|uniref:ABC transporter domain-containing protein n=1 Tax=Sphaerobolus stellatus (strain SS14) TaxID=990650 RepID=A0A0C9VAT3_SPHS4|nr:hypothetical protein M422DRAFT_208328 [Sphaerobolus stellatus SS14]
MSSIISEPEGTPSLLSVRNLVCSKADNQNIFSNISFDLYQGDILVLSGRSGAGKTTLLKCLSHLNVYEGEIRLHGKKATEYGVPSYRTRVLYVPQRPSMLPGTPREFVKVVTSYRSRRQSHEESDSKATNAAYANTLSTAKLGAVHSPIRVAEEWGIDEDLWDRPWSSLSGGESQRIALAVAVGIPGAEVLLLDEPTSALDAETMALVESTLLDLFKDEHSTVKAMVWITHSEEQGRRVGRRYLYLEEGGCLETMEMGMPASRRSRTPSTVTPTSAS